MYAQALDCPRCGYDQRGVTTTWTASCPLQGTCSECGLEIYWAEVFKPEKFEPRWCVEFTLQARRIPIASWNTALRSFRAWRFWTAIRMAYPVRPSRLLVYIALLLLSLIAIWVVQRTILTHRVWINFNQSLAVATLQSTAAVQLTSQIAELRQQMAAAQTQLNSYEDMKSRGRVPSGWDLDQMRAYAQASIDSMSADLAKLFVQQQAAAAAPLPVPPRIPFWREWLRAILMFSSDTMGPAVMIGGDLHQFPAPSQLWYAPVIPSITTIDRAIRRGGWIFWLPVLLIPAGFVLLPISRKRAQVRWAHLGRAFGYSLIIPFTAYMVCAVCHSVVIALPAFQPLNEVAVWFATWGVAFWIVIWWAAVIERYLFMPHAWWVSILLCVLSLLLSVTLSFYVHLKVRYGFSPSEVLTDFRELFQ